MSARVVLFDVDGVLSNGASAGSPRFAGRPGIRFTFDVLTALGYHIHLWSAAGADHAREVAQTLDLTGQVIGCHSKPDYPPTIEDAIEAVNGVHVVLQVDDDPTERLICWPFLQVEFFGLPAPDTREES